jgi:membrane-associated HD superfamily phosphohydrolase
LSYSPVGLVKQWLLKFFALINRKSFKQANIPTAYFMGVLFSGKMTAPFIQKVLPRYLKLAEKHNLPTVIKDFISTHHGLGKTKYFYIKQKNEIPDMFIDDLMFTYPGPNPFTREQAILMMADAVEASSRSLPDYTEKSI